MPRSREYTVTVTDDDVRFLRRAVEHYRLFAEVSEKNGQTRSAGIFRRQEFYAERFLVRLHLDEDDGPLAHRLRERRREGDHG